MKKITILLIAMLAICTSIYAQPKGASIFPHKDGVVVYEEIVQQEGSKDELYTKSRKLFTDMFNSAKHVIELEDREGGIIIGNGILDYKGGNIDFTLTLQLKDGRYKYIIDNIKYSGSINAGGIKTDFSHPINEWTWLYKNEKRSTELNDKFIALTNIIKKALSSGLTGDDEDW